MQLLLQFSADCFGTLQMFSAWNKDVHVVFLTHYNCLAETKTLFLMSTAAYVLDKKHMLWVLFSPHEYPQHMFFGQI